MEYFDREIEQAVVGSLVLWFPELKARIPEISTEDFHFEDIKGIFNRLHGLMDITPMDSTLILSHMDGPGERALLISCTDSAITILNFDGYLERLKDLSRQRRIHNRLMELAFLPDVTLKDIQSFADEEAGRQSGSNIEAKAQKAMEDYIGQIGMKSDRIFTGFKVIDKTLGGLRKPSVCHIGARPSTGKTAFALNIAEHQQERRVLIFSLEMSCEMIFERLVSSVARIDYGAFTRQQLSEKDIQKARSVMTALKEKSHLMVLDDVYHVEAMEAAIRNAKPELVIIDYIQKVTTTRKIATTREQIEFISGELKKAAKYNNCCIICLSQLSRDGKETPTMSNLKESGALEADGDYIMLLHRPYVLNKNDKSVSPSEATLLVDKNKFGETGVIDLYFDGAHQKFSEIDSRHSENPPPDTKTEDWFNEADNI